MNNFYKYLKEAKSKGKERLTFPNIKRYTLNKELKSEIMIDKEKNIIAHLNNAIGTESKFIYYIPNHEVEAITLQPKDFGGLSKTNGYYYNKDNGRIISIGRYQNSLDGGREIEVPDSIGELTDLRFLFLCGDYSYGADVYWSVVFNGLPKTIGNLKELRKMDFTGNAINRLPDSIVDLKKLEVLDLSNNFFTEIPKAIFQLSSLKSLSFAGCKLTKITVEIEKIKVLNSLALSYNALTELPSSIGNLSNLEWLGISDNRIEQLPLSILNLKNLKEISLDKKCWKNSNKANNNLFENTFDEQKVKVRVY